jgi:hypothetical protein
MNLIQQRCELSVVQLRYNVSKKGGREGGSESQVGEGASGVNLYPKHQKRGGISPREILIVTRIQFLIHSKNAPEAYMGMVACVKNIPRDPEGWRNQNHKLCLKVGRQRLIAHIVWLIGVIARQRTLSPHPIVVVNGLTTLPEGSSWFNNTST